jgi:hypothetical protein
MLLGGPLLTDESQAIAAARRTVKATAGRVTRARRSSDPAAGPRRISDASMDSAKVQKAQDTVEPNLSAKRTPSAAVVAALSDASASAKDASSRERNASPEKSSAGKPIEKAAAKGPPDSASNTKSTPESAKPPEGAKSTTDGAASRNAEPRSNAAKAPAESDPASTSGAASPTRPVVVTLEGPIFDGGDVPRAAAALDRMKGPFTRCASIESGLTKNEATIDLRFLVRAPGRAEGVDVDKARGVSSDVVRCMTSVLARSYIGAPSDDPVGVAVTVRVRRPEAASN